MAATAAATAGAGTAAAATSAASAAASALRAVSALAIGDWRIVIVTTRTALAAIGEEQRAERQSEQQQARAEHAGILMCDEAVGSANSYSSQPSAIACNHNIGRRRPTRLGKI